MKLSRLEGPVLDLQRCQHKAQQIEERLEGIDPCDESEVSVLLAQAQTMIRQAAFKLHAAQEILTRKARQLAGWKE